MSKNTRSKGKDTTVSIIEEIPAIAQVRQIKRKNSPDRGEKKIEKVGKYEKIKRKVVERKDLLI